MTFFVQPSIKQHAFIGLISDDLDLADLPPFLRVLLTTDGTVTSSLEAYFWEAIQVETVDQHPLVLEDAAPNIAREKGDEVMLRRVQLRGRDTRTVYVKAESLICTDSLPESIQADLREQKVGIGELLRECGLETYREILSVGVDYRSQSVWRTYRIVMDHQPFIQITESFPLSVYK